MVRLPLLLLFLAAVGWAGPFEINSPHLSQLLENVLNSSITQDIDAQQQPIENFRYGHQRDYQTDISDDEFNKRLGLRMPAVLPNASFFVLSENIQAPDSFDWRNHGAVSPVKNQQSCGSCWAFSAVGALEGQHALKRGALVEFSEQNLVDCDENEGGCQGGLPQLAFAFVKREGGIDTEDSYPYTGEDGECKFNSDKVGETDEGYADLVSKDEENLKLAVTIIGPISTGMQVRKETFQSYKSGVYYDPECSDDPHAMNHAVLIVGYGTDPEHGDYWLVKNSWGTTWGEDGYFRIARNKDSHCGIATMPSFPIVN